MTAYSPRNTHTAVDDRPAPVVRTTSAALNKSIPVAQIRPAPTNPRADFDEESMASLTASVAEHGVLEPILVLRKPDSTTTYELVAGERRWRAAEAAGLDRIPARVMIGVDGKTALQLQAVENLQRRDLNPIEEAEQFRQLAESGLTQTAIAKTVGKSQPYVANRLRVLELPADVQDLIRSGKLTAAHGVALARFSDFPAVVRVIADVAARHGWAARDLEKGVPATERLEHEQLAVRLTYALPAVRQACEPCPFGAYRKPAETWMQPVCLKPNHFGQLQAEAQENQRQAALELAAQTRAADATAPPTRPAKPTVTSFLGAAKPGTVTYLSCPKCGARLVVRAVPSPAGETGV